MWHVVGFLAEHGSLHCRRIDTSGNLGSGLRLGLVLEQPVSSAVMFKALYLWRGRILCLTKVCLINQLSTRFSFCWLSAEQRATCSKYDDSSLLQNTFGQQLETDLFGSDECSLALL